MISYSTLENVSDKELLQQQEYEYEIVMSI